MPNDYSWVPPDLPEWFVFKDCEWWFRAVGTEDGLPTERLNKLSMLKSGCQIRDRVAEVTTQHYSRLLKDVQGQIPKEKCLSRKYEQLGLREYYLTWAINAARAWRDGKDVL